MVISVDSCADDFIDMVFISWLYQYRSSMELYHGYGYTTIMALIKLPLKLYHTCEAVSHMWLYNACIRRGYIADVVISWLYKDHRWGYIMEFLSSFEHCLTLIFDRDLRSIVAILTVSVSFSLYSFEALSFFRFFFVDDLSFLSSSVPLSESSLPELGRGVALMISSFTMLMFASRSSLLLSMHGSLPILFNRSAATLSIVRRMSGYRSRTASKCSTDSENRLQ